MNEHPKPADQGRAKGLYDEQAQRQIQEKKLAEARRQRALVHGE